MNPKGVRLACPECTWSCVMTHEGDVPAGVTKVVEGVPYCPNDGLPMKPVASVDTTARPSPGLGEGLSLAERLEKLREAEQQVDEARVEWAEAKERATACKKAYDADVETLCTLIRRLTSVPPPQSRPPLLEAMENPVCLCGDPKDQHENGEGMCTACVCEMFELEPDTPDQRAQAALWAAQAAADGSAAVDRPAHVPAPVDEALPLPRRRRQKNTTAVHA